jgi:hypothetical protein
VFALGTTVGLLGLAYGAWGPWYATTPLKAALSFANESPEAMPFHVGRSHDYLVEVHFRKPANADDLIPILGDFTRQHHGALDISWDVSDGRVVVASGSNRDYGYAHIFGGTHDGVTIGSFPARRGASYVLQLTLRNHEPSWDAFEPYVAIALHPANLEYLLGYFFFGMVLSVLFGIAFICCVAVLVYRRVRGSRREVVAGI